MQLRLIDLEPFFFRYDTRNEPCQVLKPGIDPMRGNWTEADFQTENRDVRYKVHVDSLAEAQGIMFLCPKCWQNNAGPVGTHSVEVTFAGRGVADKDGVHNKAGQPVRWAVTGTGFADLTTKPSILLEGGCAWHGFVTNGIVS